MVCYLASIIYVAYFNYRIHILVDYIILVLEYFLGFFVSNLKLLRSLQFSFVLMLNFLKDYHQIYLKCQQNATINETVITFGEFRWPSKFDGNILPAQYLLTDSIGQIRSKIWPSPSRISNGDDMFSGSVQSPK